MSRRGMATLWICAACLSGCATAEGPGEDFGLGFDSGAAGGSPFEGAGGAEPVGMGGSPIVPFGDGGSAGALAGAGGSGSGGATAAGGAGAGGSGSGGSLLGAGGSAAAGATGAGGADPNGPCADFQLLCFDIFDMWIFNPELCKTCNQGKGCQNCLFPFAQ